MFHTFFCIITYVQKDTVCSPWLYHISYIHCVRYQRLCFLSSNPQEELEQHFAQVQSQPEILSSWLHVRHVRSMENEWLKPNWLLMVQKSPTTTGWMYKTLWKNGIFSQPQLVSLPDSWTINRITQGKQEKTIIFQSSILMWVLKDVLINHCRWLAFPTPPHAKGKKPSSSRRSFSSRLRSEVPGSPIFMMQLCSGARHIEVQIVGDQLLGVFFMKHGRMTTLIFSPTPNHTANSWEEFTVFSKCSKLQGHGNPHLSWEIPSKWKKNSRQLWFTEGCTCLSDLFFKWMEEGLEGCWVVIWAGVESGKEAIGRYSYGDFLKCWYPTTMGFLLKMIILRRFGGTTI